MVQGGSGLGTRLVVPTCITAQYFTANYSIAVLLEPTYKLQLVTRMKATTPRYHSERVQDTVLHARQAAKGLRYMIEIVSRVRRLNILAI